MGIVGAFLIGSLISRQESPAVPAKLKTYVTLALTFFMAYVGLMVGAAKGDYLELSALGGILTDKAARRDLKILDTSVIIDGRIADVAERISNCSIIPQFILRRVAISADSPGLLKTSARSSRSRHASPAAEQQFARHPNRRNRFSSGA